MLLLTLIDILEDSCESDKSFKTFNSSFLSGPGLFLFWKLSGFYVKPFKWK